MGARSVALALALTASFVGLAPAWSDESPSVFQQIQRRDPGAICWQSEKPVGVFAICIHGAGLDAQTFREVAAQLSTQGIDGVAIDWCNGAGSNKAFPFSTKIISETVEQIRRAYPNHRIWLVGESLGAVAALKVASQPRTHVDGLVCSNLAIRLVRQKLVVSEALLESAIPFRKGIPATTRALARRALSSRANSVLLSRIECCSRQVGLVNGFSILKYMASANGIRPGSPATPTLVLQGLRDELVSRTAVAKLVRRLNHDNLKFVLDADGGHLLLQENRASSETVSCLMQWLRSDHSVPQKEFEVISSHPISKGEAKQIAKLRKLAGMEDSTEMGATLAAPTPLSLKNLFEKN